MNQKVNCTRCNDFLALYDQDRKMFRPHIPRNRKLGSYFVLLPASIICSSCRDKSIDIKTGDYEIDKEVTCSLCRKKLFEMHLSDSLGVGALINLPHVSEIWCTNCFMECEKCNSPYNLTHLLNTGEDIGIRFDHIKP